MTTASPAGAQDAVAQQIAALRAQAAALGGQAAALLAEAAAVSASADALAALDWSAPPVLPVMSLAALSSVQVQAAAPVEVTAPVVLDSDAPAGGSRAILTVTGVRADRFEGGVIPNGPVPVAAGGRLGQAKFRFAAHTGKFFRESAVVSIHDPVNATLGVSSVGFDVSGGTGTAANPSGLPWPSGVTTPSNDVGMIAEIRAFAAARGRPVDIVNVKANGNRLIGDLENAVTHKGPVYAALAAENIQVSQVLDCLCDGEPDAIRRANAGAFDAAWTRMAQALASFPKVQGRPYSVRLLHELDGTPNWAPQKDPAGWVAAWRRCSLILKANIPGVLIDWNWLRNPEGLGYADVWPGDDVVDIVGMDPYGNQDGLTSDAAFAAYAMRGTPAAPAGPEQGILFAKWRGKLFGWAEWAVTNTKGPHSDRDSAAYVRGMLGLCSRYRDLCAYEIYFHIDDAGNQPDGDHNHLLFGPGSVSPDAAAEYVRLMAAGA